MKLGDNKNDEVSFVIAKAGDQAYNEACDVRREVFCKEFGWAEEDEFMEEELCTYVIAKVHGKAVGTARVREFQEERRIQRVAVLKEYRKYGIGSKLIKFVIGNLLQEEGPDITVFARRPALEFYKRLGFKETGYEDVRGGEPHHEMKLDESAF